MAYIKIILLLIIYWTGHSGLAQSAFTFAEKIIEPGTRTYITIPVDDGEESTVIPITIFHGTQDGSTLGITAGVHGYEYPPIVAAQQLIEQIDVSQLRGTIILVQIANVPSFLHRSPFVNPIDGKNLNRAFPGSASGTLTEKIAEIITNQVIARSDFFLDIHGGDASEDLMPYAAYYDNDQQVGSSQQGKAMAVALGFDHIIRFDTNGKEYMEEEQPSLYCSAEAFKRNMPSIDIECGRLGQTNPSLAHKIEKGVLNLLHHLQMLPNKLTDDSNRKIIHIDQRAYISSTYQGIFYPAKSAGAYVVEGMKLGYITDFFGQVLDTIYADESGVILLIIGTPPVNEGETLAVIGAVEQ